MARGHGLIYVTFSNNNDCLISLQTLGYRSLGDIRNDKQAVCLSGLETGEHLLIVENNVW